MKDVLRKTLEQARLIMLYHDEQIQDAEIDPNHRVVVRDRLDLAKLHSASSDR